MTLIQRPVTQEETDRGVEACKALGTQTHTSKDSSRLPSDVPRILALKEADPIHATLTKKTSFSKVRAGNIRSLVKNDYIV